MNSLAVEVEFPKAIGVFVNDESVHIDLSDGRTISAPLIWYPRLYHGSKGERNNFRIIGSGDGIHWIDLDEDVSVESLILGRQSTETQSSLQKWLENRKSTSH